MQEIPNPAEPVSPPVLQGYACLIAVAVGNTRTRVGVFHHADLNESVSLDNDDLGAISTHVSELVGRQDPELDPIVVISSVRPSVSGPLTESIKGGVPVYEVGKDLPIHINHTLDEEGAKTVGQDRLLNAIGAFSRTGQATVVVDVGTAVTVDFVDGEGTFCGGAIAPGLSMMLNALANNTEQLPRTQYAPLPEGEAFGTSTPAAISLGVSASIQGLVRALTERYALAYGGYPQIVATGGDVGLLEADEVIEHFVPDLQLIGIQVTSARALADRGDDD